MVIADNLFGLTKEVWDNEKDMWKLKEFEELLSFFKVMYHNLCYFVYITCLHSSVRLQQAIDDISEEKNCLRNTVLVVHGSDKQSHFLIEALPKSGVDWTWTICTWVKETGSARSQGPMIRYDIEKWFCC